MTYYTDKVKAYQTIYALVKAGRYDEKQIISWIEERSGFGKKFTSSYLNDKIAQKLFIRDKKTEIISIPNLPAGGSIINED